MSEILINTACYLITLILVTRGVVQLELKVDME